jgi:hypothetical protein
MMCLNPKEFESRLFYHALARERHFFPLCRKPLLSHVSAYLVNSLTIGLASVPAH